MDLSKWLLDSVSEWLLLLAASIFAFSVLITLLIDGIVLIFKKFNSRREKRKEYKSFHKGLFQS